MSCPGHPRRPGHTHGLFFGNAKKDVIVMPYVSKRRKGPRFPRKNEKKKGPAQKLLYS